MAEQQRSAVEWLPAARAGSAEALGRMLEACRGYLLAVARRELDADLQAKGSASDLVQETFLEAQRDLVQFQGGNETDLLAWLRRLLLNNISNFARSYRGTQKRQIGGEVSLAGGDSSDQLGEGVVADIASPSEQAMRHERADAVERVLAQLPADYREVILLRYREQLPFEEIAQRMDRSNNAVRKLWARAVERFQEEMGSPP
jgi:RNA polymerase sigma-70 factor (ECF subfamily)